MRRIISILLENEAGALSRVIGLFAQRNYNIESLTVAPTDDKSLSRLTLTTSATDVEVEQITKQLNKLIEVVKLADLTDGEHVERELMLLKVKASGAQRAEVKRVSDIFRGQIIDVTASTYEKLDAFINALSESVVLEVVRTGVTGLSRGEKVLAL
jgi:acetolactate synthase-1/3 small subunit